MNYKFIFLKIFIILLLSSCTGANYSRPIFLPLTNHDKLLSPFTNMPFEDQIFTLKEPIVSEREEGFVQIIIPYEEKSNNLLKDDIVLLFCIQPEYTTPRVKHWELAFSKTSQNNNFKFSSDNRIVLLVRQMEFNERTKVWITLVKDLNYPELINLEFREKPSVSAKRISNILVTKGPSFGNRLFEQIF